MKCDAKAQKVDQYFSVGDLVMRGPQPQEAVDLLKSVNTTVWILGNHEEMYHQLADHKDEFQLKTPKNIMSVILDDYDKKHLDSKSLKFLADLPIKQSITIEDVPIDVFHASPKKTFGVQVRPTDPQKNFDQLMKHSKSLVAIYGHTHQQTMRYSRDGQLILNGGTVGMPVTINHDQRAQYLILTLDQGNIIGIDFRKVTYDVEQAIQIAKTADLPYADLYINTLKNCVYSYSQDDVAKLNHENHYKKLAKKLLK